MGGKRRVTWRRRFDKGSTLDFAGIFFREVPDMPERIKTVVACEENRT